MVTSSADTKRPLKESAWKRINPWWVVRNIIDGIEMFVKLGFIFSLLFFFLYCIICSTSFIIQNGFDDCMRHDAITALGVILTGVTIMIWSVLSISYIYDKSRSDGQNKWR